jgi:hypothetical protein
VSQNDDKDQNQDQEDQRASTDQYDFAHYIGLQKVGATQKNLPERLEGEVSTSHRVVPELAPHFRCQAGGWVDTLSLLEFVVSRGRTTRKMLHFAGKLLHAVRLRRSEPFAASGDTTDPA